MLIKITYNAQKERRFPKGCIFVTRNIVDLLFVTRNIADFVTESVIYIKHAVTGHCHTNDHCLLHNFLARHEFYM